MEVPPLQKDKLHAFLTSFCRENMKNQLAA